MRLGLGLGLSQRTGGATAIANLIVKSQKFDNAAWTKSLYTVTADTTAAPDGTTTADTITEGTTSAGRYVSSTTFTVVASSPYTLAVYAKYIGQQYIQMTDTGGLWRCNFDIQNGIVGTASGCTGFIVAAANGFYRLVVERTTASETTTGLAIAGITALTDARIPTYLGSSRQTALWQASCIPGSFADGGSATVTA